MRSGTSVSSIMLAVALGGVCGAALVAIVIGVGLWVVFQQDLPVLMMLSWKIWAGSAAVSLFCAAGAGAAAYVAEVTE